MDSMLFFIRFVLGAIVLMMLVFFIVVPLTNKYLIPSRHGRNAVSVINTWVLQLRDDLSATTSVTELQTVVYISMDTDEKISLGKSFGSRAYDNEHKICLYSPEKRIDKYCKTFLDTIAFHPFTIEGRGENNQIETTIKVTKNGEGYEVTIT
ncbi:MAG: hypothetical protein ACOCWQ_00850 [Nanoarchaeota archaeon]